MAILGKMDDEELAEFLASRGAINNAILVELAENEQPKPKKPKATRANNTAKKETVYTSFNCFYYTKLKPRFVSCEWGTEV
jgi:hypothetical protein